MAAKWEIAWGNLDREIDLVRAPICGLDADDA